VRGALRPVRPLRLCDPREGFADRGAVCSLLSPKEREKGVVGLGGSGEEGEEEMRLHFCQRLTGDLKVLAHQAKARCGMCNVASPRSLTDGGVNARPTSDIDEALPPPLPPPPAPLDFSEPPPPPSESRSPSISPCCLLRSFCGNQGLPVTICSKHAREREEMEDVGEGEAESTRQGVCPQGGSRLACRFRISPSCLWHIPTTSFHF